MNHVHAWLVDFGPKERRAENFDRRYGRRWLVWCVETDAELIGRTHEGYGRVLRRALMWWEMMAEQVHLHVHRGAKTMAAVRLAQAEVRLDAAMEAIR